MERSELIAELIAGATVVTANDRLARALHQAVADHWIAQGKTVWETPKALTLSALLDQHHEALCASGDAAAVRVLESHEAEALWEKVIEGSIARVLRNEPLLQVRALAKLANDARGIVLRHRLGFGTAATPSRTPSGELGLDAREFALWHEVYTKRLAELHGTDAAALPDLIAESWQRGVMKPPARAIFEGFDEFTPQGVALIEALRAAGSQVTMPVPFVGPEVPPAGAVRVELDDARREIERAAAWAAGKLKADPEARLGIVVPSLEEHRQTVIDALDAMLEPQQMVLGAEVVSAPRYNLSLGKPLIAWPLISDALRLLRLAGHEVEWRDASAVLRSPFFAHDRDAAAELELWMRKHLPERFPLEALRKGVELIYQPGETPGSSPTPPVIQFDPFSTKEQRLPSAWATQAAQLLKSTGWPGARALDGAERQTLDKWDEALRSVCRLDATLGEVPWSRFVARLASICQDMDFQPRTPPAPIQVLGVLEGAVLEFDALWVMGLDDERWPPAARPNPLLPIRLQVEAITPNSSAAERLVHAQRITARLLAAATEVIVSSPRNEGDAEHRPSPLIAGLPLLDEKRDAARLPAFVPVESHWVINQATERFSDAPVPLAAGELARGGTSLIQHQALCPFRAFAQHRLGAEELEQPSDASDAISRGQLIHEVLERVWGALKDKATLDGYFAESPPERLRELVKHHVITTIEHAAREAPAQWPLRLKVLEQQRLIARVLEWLEVERARAPFTVKEREQWHTLELGGLTLAGRVDRVDEVGGKPVYIDYKTGKVDWRKWLGARPQEPQLPLYAVTAGAEAAGVLFAQVRVGEHGFAGLAADAALAPGLETWPPTKAKGEAVAGALHQAKDWTELQQYWRSNLTGLAAEFKAGVATVTPDWKAKACDHCHLHMLCRIDELGGAPDSDSDSDSLSPSGGEGGGEGSP